MTSPGPSQRASKRGGEFLGSWVRLRVMFVMFVILAMFVVEMMTFLEMKKVMKKVMEGLSLVLNCVAMELYLVYAYVTP